MLESESSCTSTSVVVDSLFIVLCSYHVKPIASQKNVIQVLLTYTYIFDMGEALQLVSCQ